MRNVTIEVLLIPWWGVEERLGTEKWLVETKEAFEALNSHITVKLIWQPADAWMAEGGISRGLELLKAAHAARSGPCILNYEPSTWWFVEDMINGNLVAFEDYLPKEEIEHWNLKDRLFARWQGKTYSGPFYNNARLWAYNKAHLTQVGWDPDGPPQTWDGFLELGALLNEAGITPVAAGMKDGWYADFPWLHFAPQTLDNEAEWYDMLLGVSREKLSDPRFIEPWVRLKEMIDNDFFIDDVNSLGLYEGFELFPQGRATFVNLAEKELKRFATSLGRENIGLMKLSPKFAAGALGEKVPGGAFHIGVTDWCPNKQEAVDFVAFTHTPERIRRLYEITGGMIADDRFDPAWIGDDPLDLQRYEWHRDAITISLWNTTAPNQAEWLFRGASGLFEGTMTPQEVGELGQRSTELWRKTDPAMVESFKKWLSEGLRTLQ